LARIGASALPALLPDYIARWYLTAMMQAFRSARQQRSPAMMMLHGAPRPDLLITRYLLWIEQFARFEMRGEMNRTQPALNLRDGLGLGGEQVWGNL
jgi:hypothetical protein